MRPTHLSFLNARKKQALQNSKAGLAGSKDLISESFMGGTQYLLSLYSSNWKLTNCLISRLLLTSFMITDIEAVLFKKDTESF
jgi:hypothetical protein